MEAHDFFSCDDAAYCDIITIIPRTAQEVVPQPDARDVFRDVSERAVRLGNRPAEPVEAHVEGLEPPEGGELEGQGARERVVRLRGGDGGCMVSFPETWWEDPQEDEA